MNLLSGSAPNMSSDPAVSTLPRISTPSSASSDGHPPLPPSNSQIEAIIQMATSTASSADSRTPSRDTRTQLFVGNLPYRVRWQDLKDLFRKSGTVLRADVSLGPDNRSKGYGTVMLATAEDAARAIEMFNGYNWQTRTLEVRPDRLPPDFENQSFMATANPGSLPSSSAGPAFPFPVHQIPYGASMGDHATASLDDLELPKLLGDRPRASSGAGCRSLFVGNLPFHCQWQDLKDLFRQAGTIVRADVALGADGRSRGFGTVSFANDGDAERAVNIFNGYEFNGRTLKVHYDKYSQGQTSQSPITLPSLSATSLPNLHHGHPNAPTHIPIPMPPPPTAFEHIISGHQSPSQLENPFGQISPYDLFPPHIAAIAANATAQAYMNNSPRSPSAVPSSTTHLAAASVSTTSSILPSNESKQCSTPPRSQRNSVDRKSVTTTPSYNPPHPGPIALPSPPLHAFPHIPGPMSPQQGLPPITPSMPPFTFVPQNATPPLSAHFLSPGVGLSPYSSSGTMSPGVFYHPSPNQRHPVGPVWNPAPGAPIHLHSPVGSPGSPGFYVMTPEPPPHGIEAASVHVGLGMSDYFSVPLPPQQSEGYFPPISALRESRLSSEISRGEGGSGVTDSDVERNISEDSVPAASDGASLSDPGLGEVRAQSSARASLEDVELGGEDCPEMYQTTQGFGDNEEMWTGAHTPHRTNSDGARVTVTSTQPTEPTQWPFGEQTGRTAQECLIGGNVSMHSERRASWTPEATRTEFRHGLPA